MPIYYLDGTTLSNSTAAFTDEELTICAADGFYSEGSISRELLNCSFEEVQTCPSCGGGGGTYGFYTSAPVPVCDDFCVSEANYMMTIGRTNAYIGLQSGDFISGEVLAYDRWYAYSNVINTSTLEDNNSWRIFKTYADDPANPGANQNKVEIIKRCGATQCIAL